MSSEFMLRFLYRYCLIVSTLMQVIILDKFSHPFRSKWSLKITTLNKIQQPNINHNEHSAPNLTAFKKLYTFIIK